MQIKVKPGNVFTATFTKDQLIDYIETAFGALVVVDHHNKIIQPTEVSAGSELFVANGSQFDLAFTIKDIV